MSVVTVEFEDQGSATHMVLTQEFLKEPLTWKAATGVGAVPSIDWMHISEQQNTENIFGGKRE